MRGSRLILITAVLMLALLPMMASVSSEAASSARDPRPSVAMAQPLASARSASVVIARHAESKQTLPESGILVLVGSGLFALAALVRRTS